MAKTVTVTKPGTKRPAGSIQTRPHRKNFISRCIDIIISDIRARLTDYEVVANDTAPGWEEYKQFYELAKGKR
jgi:hypothetical protein